MTRIEITAEKCRGCKKCLRSCPFGAIDMHRKTAHINDNCRLCSACVSSCPFGAISLESERFTQHDVSQYKGLWVFAETFCGSLRPVSLELLGQATLLARDMECAVTAIMLGSNVHSLAEELISHGANRVIFAESDSLADFNDEIYTDIVSDMVQQEKPAAILLGATARGRSFAPRLAARLGTGLTADCTELGYDKERQLLMQTRPAFGGNIMATIVCPDHRPQIATVRPHVFKIPSPDPKRSGEIVQFPIQANGVSRVKVLSHILRNADDISVADADIIVAVGRGIGSEKNISLARTLANILGGTVGASRAVVDNGWMPYSAQIGQTGKTVAPKLYIACGISGAIQHTVGMSGADVIIAVNSDPDAPIFSVANYCVLEDCVQFLQALIDELKNSASSN